MDKENTVVSNIVDFASGRHAKEESDDLLMFSDAGLSMKYFRLDSGEKVEFIIDNYIALPEQFDAMTELVKLNIISEQEYRRSRNRDNIRVQKSGTSDPTASMAVMNVMIDEAIKDNDFSEIIHDRRAAERYSRALDGIECMRYDYHIVGVYIRLLSPIERKLLEDYINARADGGRVIELGEKYRYTESNSVYRKIKTIKIKIADWASPGLDRRYGEMTA